MSAVILDKPSLNALKFTLRAEFPAIKSSHITEAVASALGFNTHAALLTTVAEQAADPGIQTLSDEKFIARLLDFGYPVPPAFDFELLDKKKSLLISTLPPEARGIAYESTKKKAWRNLAVAAVNAALRLKLFSLRPDDNRWAGADSKTGALFDFTLPNGLPGRGYVRDVGYGELAVTVAVCPKGDKWTQHCCDFSVGDAFIHFWLERKAGAWLQTGACDLTCRRKLAPELASLQVAPEGYGDRGSLYM